MIEYRGMRTTNVDFGKQATKHIVQRNIADRVLVGASQGIGNAILTTPLIKALTSMHLKVDILLPETGLLNGAERIFVGMEGVKCLPPEGIKNRRYLLGLQTMWPQQGIEDYVAQIRFAPNINKVWMDGIPAHEVDINMSLARSLKFEGKTPDLYCNYYHVPGNFDRSKRNVGIHICRRYNQQFMANRQLHNPLEIGRELESRGYRVFIIGHEGAVTPQDMQDHPTFVYCLGRELEEVAGLIRELDCMINEDSGIMHVTAAMKTPQIAIFGPTSDVKNAPWSDQAVIIRKDIPCGPCQYTENATKCCNNICMDISAADIVQHVIDLI
jgi:ADP-heptose:LPS heptosyltransferase